MSKVLVVSADRTDDNGHAINLGDALLSDALASALRARGHIVEVADFGLSERTGRRRRVRLRGLKDLLNVIRRVDAVVLGGGTLVQDDTPRKLIGGLPRLLFVTSLAGRCMGKKIAFFGVGCDPVTRWMPKLLLKCALSTGPVWVRDVDSLDRCRSWGLNAQLAADASWLFAHEFMGEEEAGDEKVAVDRSGVIVALNGEDARAVSAETISELRSRFGDVTFLAMSQADPFNDAASLENSVSKEFGLITHSLSWEDAVRKIRRASAIIASRMHAMYISAMVSTPTFAISGRPKVDSFVAEFGLPKAATLSSIGSLPLLVDGDARERAIGRAVAAVGNLDEYIRSEA